MPLALLCLRLAPCGALCKPRLPLPALCLSHPLRGPLPTCCWPAPCPSSACRPLQPLELLKFLSEIVVSLVVSFGGLVWPGQLSAPAGFAVCMSSSQCLMFVVCHCGSAACSRPGARRHASLCRPEQQCLLCSCPCWQERLPKPDPAQLRRQLAADSPRAAARPAAGASGSGSSGAASSAAAQPSPSPRTAPAVAIVGSAAGSSGAAAGGAAARRAMLEDMGVATADWETVLQELKSLEAAGAPGQGPAANGSSSTSGRSKHHRWRAASERTPEVPAGAAGGAAGHPVVLVAAV